MSNYREYDNAPNMKQNIGRRFEFIDIGNKSKEYTLHYDVQDGYYGVNEKSKVFFVMDGYGIAVIHSNNTFTWIEPPLATASEVSHPHYYGGEDNVYEAIKVIQAHDLNFCLGNAIKYVLRAGKKESDTRIKDLQKAIEYLQFEIEKG
jgi:hypothetical protein